MRADWHLQLAVDDKQLEPVGVGLVGVAGLGVVKRAVNRCVPGGVLVAASSVGPIICTSLESQQYTSKSTYAQQLAYYACLSFRGTSNIAKQLIQIY